MAGARPHPRSLSKLQQLRFLANDTLIYGAASAINKSFALILFPLLTRNLSVADYGRLDLALYAAMLLGLIIVWGQDSAVARLFFEDEDTSDRQQIISQALLVMFGHLLVVTVLIALLSQTLIPSGFFGKEAPAIVAMLSLYAPITGLLSFCQSVLKWTFERNKYIVLALGMPALNLMGMLALARFGEFEVLTALGVLTTTGAAFLCLGLFLMRRWLVLPRGLAFVRNLVPLALPYGVISAIGAVSPVVERAVVSGRFGAADLGLYAAAAKIASLAMMLAIAFQMGWGPFAYSIYKEPDAIRTYNLVLRIFTAVMCAAVLCLAAVADPVSSLLAGERYRGAAMFVFPIAMAFGMQAIGWITEIGIHLSKKTYLSLIGFTFFLAISLAGIFYLSSVFGIIGVPIGAMAGQLAMVIVAAVVAQRAYPLAWQYRLPVATVAITLASGAAAGIARWSVSSASVWPYYAAGAGLVVAINLAFGLDAVDRRKLAGLIRSTRRGSHD